MQYSERGHEPLVNFYQRKTLGKSAAMKNLLWLKYFRRIILSFKSKFDMIHVAFLNLFNLSCCIIYDKITLVYLWNSTSVAFEKWDSKTTQLTFICSKSTIETQEMRQWHCSSVFISFDLISNFFLVFLLLTLNK